VGVDVPGFGAPISGAGVASGGSAQTGKAAPKITKQAKNAIDFRMVYTPTFLLANLVPFVRVFPLIFFPANERNRSFSTNFKSIAS
jgi:hypothetical protein